MDMSKQTGKAGRDPVTAKEVLQTLKSLGSPKARESMARFGMVVDNAQGITTPVLKAFARKLPRDHKLAAELWKSGIFESRAIAAMIDEPAKVTAAQMDRWARVFNSWAICDACCCYLFRQTAHAWEKAVEWSEAAAEYHKRAGFALMAYLAVHDKTAADARFIELLPVIEREADDDRPFVRKAVNWALRQIGKRNRRLNAVAIEAGERIRARGTKSARWIAADALRELRGDKVRRRLQAR
jgi:3-methyladenine DNA glycosylase AlkD